MDWISSSPQTQNGNFGDVDRLGSELSKQLHCAVHYPAYGKNIFECECGVIFPLYMVKGGNWPALVDKHKMERRLIRA